MATKKPGRPKVERTEDEILRPVRVDLTPEVHKLLRKVAADADVSMAALARTAVEEYAREEFKRRGLK